MVGWQRCLVAVWAMSENPYESPKEQNQPPRKPYQIAAATGCLVAASIPAGFICGGITCYSVGVAGEAVNTEAGWTLDILPALIVIVLVPCLAYFAIRRAVPNELMFRYKLRTLLIVLGIAPPVIAATLWLVQSGRLGWGFLFIVVLTIVVVIIVLAEELMS